MITKTVINLSFRVRCRPTSTQNARDERGNPENTPRLRQESGGQSNSAPKQDFLRPKVKEHRSPLLFTQVFEPISTRLEENPRGYGECKH